MKDEIFDITIVGAGPVGLYATYYSGLRDMKVKLIDALPQLGGQLTALYPEKFIYDVAGFPEILAKELAENLIAQAMQYEPAIFLNEKIIKLESLEDEKIIKLTSEGGNIHFSKTVVLSLGIGAFVPRKLDIPDVKRLEGRGIHYVVKDKSIFRGKNILIVGGGDSAVDWALNLEGIAKHITLIHRRDVFKAHEDSLRKLFNSTVEVKTFYELKRIHGDEHVKGATIFDNRTGEEIYLDVQHILLFLGFLANLEFIQSWGLEIDKNAIKVNSKMETNIPGVYAAGDIVNYPGKLKLISTGFGEAAIAVNNAKNYIEPASKYFPGHSSDFVPKKLKSK
ncbi:thioredoxin reductase (NADPH) [Candidatus Kryptobacter tengchongensis]|uniref:Ferredoxin--NADP reductase n=1 Tax=Kryptobacter tengchongensis TaxID=1643429 RepID=A0A656D2E0_KRYT1|nr:NAD(P)/FAD-dependent oxidoreductase [Candidatus Kryptobacter tengchongensis]CUS97261.1 thioredoxin reductase (NADPH) [Candidatus Kryptobacter tengchongensis]CUU10038.1 thioredoxin reductase (NADPH) [Candidatus Kryptobacter tengchongensis]